MASTYWMKFYYDMLDDPKMGRMSDHLWRRVSEFLLIAGESGNGGYLPSVEDMSWRLRSTPEEITECLEAIARVGIVTLTPDGWFVINFAKRQDAASNAERQRLYREKLRKSNENSNEPVTIRHTDIDIDIDKDKDRDADVDSNNNIIPETPYKPLEEAYVKATGAYIPVGGGAQTHKWVDAFLKMNAIPGVTPDDITEALVILSEKNYQVVGPSSIINTVQGVVTNRNIKKNSNGSRSGKSAQVDDEVEKLIERAKNGKRR